MKKTALQERSNRPLLKTAPLPFLMLIMVAVLVRPLPLNAFSLEKGDLYLDVSNAVECRAPVAFNREIPKEESSFFIEIKPKASYGDHLSFSAYIRSGFNGGAQHAQDDNPLIGFNKIYPSRNWYIDISEAYFSLYLSDLDIRAGIQKYSWGTLDMFNPTDNLNPWDMRHFMSTEAIEKKVGIPSVRLLYGSSYETVLIETIWIPFYVPYRLPDPDDRWFPPIFDALDRLTIAPFPPITVKTIYEDADLPARTLEHSEFALRLSRTLGSLDMGVSYFYGYDPQPFFESRGKIIADVRYFPPELNTTYLNTLYPVFNRMQVFGFDAATSRGSFTYRLEGAFFKGKYFDTNLDAVDSLVDNFKFPEDLFALVPSMTLSPRANGITLEIPYDVPIAYKKNYCSIGAGLDYQWAAHMIVFAIIGNYIFDHHDEPLMYETFETTFFLAARSQFLGDTLKIEGGLGVNPMQSMWMLNINGRYSVTDNCSLGASLLLIEGDSRTPYGQFHRHDQIEFFVRYTF